MHIDMYMYMQACRFSPLLGFIEVTMQAPGATGVVKSPNAERAQHPSIMQDDPHDGQGSPTRLEAYSLGTGYWAVWVL